jgi:HAE1 family hydrophobic/amphiphilic exporter-1
LTEIRNLVVREDGLRLQDVADVVYEEPRLEYGRHLNGSFAVGITVSKEAGANAVTICDAIESKIEQMQADPELEGIDLLIWFNQGQEIRETLSDLSSTGVFGAILASLVLFAFLRRLSITSVSVLCIPFSLVVACGIIWAQGKSMNTITLLGLIVGIGMLVDNAVVVVENIFRHQQRGEDRLTATRNGAREVATAVVAATSTSIIVFLPVIFNKPSEMNIILKELGITVCLTLLASLFISQTLIPLATSRFLRARLQPKSRIIDALERRYVQVLEYNLRHRWLTPVIGILVIVSAVYPFVRVDKNFETTHEQVFIQLQYEFSEELSLDRKEQVVSLVEKVIIPEKERLGLKAVYSFWSDHFTVSRLYMEDDRTNENAMMGTRSMLRALLPELPGVKLEFRDRHRGWHRGGGKRVSFQIVGEDSAVLEELSEKAKRLMDDIPGLVDPWSSSEEGGIELHVDLDRALAANFGIPLTQPAEVISLTFRGRRLQRFRTPHGEREMVLTLDEQETESLSQLRDLPLLTDEGTKIPLASVADFHLQPSPERIQRDNRRTSVWVGARYETGTSADYVPKVMSALQSMEFPYGYTWTFRDWEERRREQSMEFLTDLLLALMLVFAVMAGLFESVRQAVGLMVALPFALSGAVWTLFITKTDFDQPASIGLLLLIGVVVNNGIVMLAHINHYRRQGMPRHEAMILGGRERLRPILMTAITTIVGLLPMAVQKPSLAGVYYYSMALVIMGGLFVSTFLTSILLPTNASLAEDIFGWVGGLFQRVLTKKSNT